MMRFVKNPNIPEGMVTAVLVDGRMRKDALKELEKMGIEAIKTQPVSGLYEAVSYHPDMFIHHIGGNNIVAAPNSPVDTIEKLKLLGFNIIYGCKTITGKYPYDIAYNVARIEGYAICNAAYTDYILLGLIEDYGIKIIDVKQGYSKCSVCIAGPGIIITSDDGIYRKLFKYDFEILKISPGFIELSGLNYGFIGGASGMVAHNVLAFSGDITNHPDFKKIYNFLDNNGINIKILDHGVLQDVGTIIPLKEII